MPVRPPRPAIGYAQYRQSGRMKSIEKFLQRAMNAVIVTSLALMVGMVFCNVVLRFAFNSGFTLTEELSRLMFLWLIFVGSVVAMKEGSHLGVDSLVAKLPRAGKVFCVLAGNVLMLWVCWLFFVGSWRQTVVGLGTDMPASGISMAYHYATGLVMSVGVAVCVLVNTWRVLTGRARDEELVQVRDSEDAERERSPVDDAAPPVAENHR
jgi:TRAP-type C4-dicarboxylate transport system permease small subunit